MLETLSKFYTKSRLIVLDVILLNLSLLMSFYFRFSSEWINYWDINYLILTSLIGFIVLYFSNLYHKIWRYASIDELKEIIKVSVVINSFLVIAFYFFNVSVPRSILILNAILTIFALGSLRFFLRFLKEYYIKYNNYKNGKKIRPMSWL